MLKPGVAFVGLDLGDKRSTVFVPDQDGELIEEARVPTIELAFRRGLRRWRRRGTFWLRNGRGRTAPEQENHSGENDEAAPQLAVSYE